MVQASRRPTGVTVVVVLLVVSAVVNLLTALLEVRREDAAGISWVVTVVALLIAAVYLVLAKGIADGRQVARVIVAVATSLSIVGSLMTMFTQPHLWPTLMIQVLFGGFVLALLYTERATAFFTGKVA